MNKENNSEPLRRLTYEDKEIVLVGTAHVSKESVDLVKSVIETEKPDTVCVEYCEGRYQAIRRKDQWQNTDIIKVIKEKKVFVLLMNLIMAAFQKRMAAKLDVQVGQEMLQAIDSAEAIGAEIYLADRSIQVTLGRTWRQMGMWTRIKLFFQLLLSFGGVDEIDEQEVERLKQRDVLESILEEFGQSLPSLRRTLIDERDQYLAAKIRQAPGKKIVAVVGAGHLPGIEKNWLEPIDLDALTVMPTKSRFSGMLKWLIPAAILAFIIYGFTKGGAGVGKDMVIWWVVVNGVLSALGALLALGHPLTILSAMVAAPFTSLNPMIAAGWVSGLVEAFSRKPKVKDFEHLQNDILSVKGFWHNKVTRILLVVVFTNLGSAAGTFIALPMMMRIMHVG